MFNFDNLNSVKKKVEKLDEKRNDYFKLSFSEALSSLNKFRKSPDFDPMLLKKAAYRLIETMEQKRSKPEPYIVLSCIFYMINEDRLAIKYLKIASILAPDLPQVTELKKLLSNVS